MPSSIATPQPNLSGGEPIKEFHVFPDLSAELRIRVWQMAYDSIPDTLIYRFRLSFSELPDSERIDEVEQLKTPMAFLVPLEEVKDLNRELRSLRRVNTECRHEGERLFDTCLRLNQTEQGDTTDLHPPISLPWKASRNFLCLAEVTEADLECVEEASTSFIDQIFKTAQLLGLGMDRHHRHGLDQTQWLGYEPFAEFISQFTQIRHVSLVSDKLMSEADISDIDDDMRSSFILSCWDDWFGRVHEDVIGTHYQEPWVVTADDHLTALEDFVSGMLNCGDDFGMDTLSDISYGMIFRTRKNLDFLLWDRGLLDELLPHEMVCDDFSKGNEDL